MKNFPIDWVVDQDLPGIRKYKTYTGYTIDCPFCGNRKHKFDINTAKNRARCNVCGAGFNSLTLHASLCNISNKSAYTDLWNRYKGLDSAYKAQIEVSTSVLQEEEVTPLWLRSAVYHGFLELLTLSDEHREVLRKRGLTDKDIERLMFRDVPTKEMDIYDILTYLRCRNRNIERYFRKHDVRIAGFYDLMSAEPKAVARKPGILCPIVVKSPHSADDYLDGKQTEDEDLISGFQIRYDDAPKDKRYVYYTSLEKVTGCGFTGYESIHFRLPDSYFEPETMRFGQPKLDRVLLTEGCLKADVASALSDGTPFIAVLGVSNQRLLTDACRLLKSRYGTKEIVLAFDQDYEDNKNVEKSLNSAKEKISAVGLQISECHWHEEYVAKGIKGIDDLLLFQRKE